MTLSIKTTDLKNTCPKCGYQFDATTSFEGQTPKAGDVAVCLNCKAVLRFNEGMSMSTVDREELATLPYHIRKGIFEMQLGLSIIKQRRKNK